MEVLVSLATTGEQVYSAAFSEIQDRYVWELRLQICREQASAPYFSFVLFREQDLLDDTATIGAYGEACQEGVLHLQLIIRDLRPLQMKKDELSSVVLNSNSEASYGPLCHEEYT